MGFPCDQSLSGSHQLVMTLPELDKPSVLGDSFPDSPRVLVVAAAVFTGLLVLVVWWMLDRMFHRRVLRGQARAKRSA